MIKNPHILSSAEFADLCGVEKSTLRFYRDSGILLPGRILDNGYGKYEPLQGLDIARIRLLEDCGIPLKEIGEGNRALLCNFPYEELAEHLSMEQLSLSARQAMLSSARLIAEGADRSEPSALVHGSGSRFFLFLQYQKPTDDIEYNLIHSIKKISSLCSDYLHTSPFLLGRVVRAEDLRAGRSEKVMGLVVPIPEEIARSGCLPEEHLLQAGASESVRLFYNGRPYAYREHYSRVFRFIRENGLEICGDGMEFWTNGGRTGRAGSYATMIDIPVRRREGGA